MCRESASVRFAPGSHVSRRLRRRNPLLRRCRGRLRRGRTWTWAGRRLRFDRGASCIRRLGRAIPGWRNGCGQRLARRRHPLAVRSLLHHSPSRQHEDGYARTENHGEHRPCEEGAHRRGSGTSRRSIGNGRWDRAEPSALDEPRGRKRRWRRKAFGFAVIDLDDFFFARGFARNGHGRKWRRCRAHSRWRRRKLRGSQGSPLHGHRSNIVRRERGSFEAKIAPIDGRRGDHG
jgi:hypothetical protein